jgi:hypothetical protein
MLCGKASIDTPTKFEKFLRSEKSSPTTPNLPTTFTPVGLETWVKPPTLDGLFFYFQLQVGPRPWILPRLKLQRFARYSKEPNFIERYFNQHTYW